MNKVIYVKTTGTCNLDCSHCFTNGKNGDKTQFDPLKTAQWISDFMKQYPEDTDYHFEFHGGEPFLVPLEKMRLFADKFQGRDNISMCANSNLTFKLTDDHIVFIKNYFGSWIGTSWDIWHRWANQKQYDLWRKNLQTLHDHGVGISVKIAVTKELISKTADWFIDQMEELPVVECSLERLTLDGTANENTHIFPNNEEQDNWYLALLKRYVERKPRVKIKTLDILQAKIKNNVVKVDTNCRNCEQNLVTINPDGSLSGCPNAATANPHGTIHKPVEEFLTSDGRVDQIVKELTWGPGCMSCDVYDLCGGDCHRLPWQNGRCGGLKNTLRYLSGRDLTSNLIIKV